MNRRIFAKTVIGTMGASLVVTGALASNNNSSATQTKFEAGHQMTTDDGLKMTLSQYELPTADKDNKQFTLTFDVENPSDQLVEKIYHLTDHKGIKHQIYMKPIDHKQLLAEFNWRTHA